MKDRALGGTGSKKRVNSKVKGNRNEVDVAKALSEWVGVEFRRTPASGAIHVPLDWLNGDVFCTKKDFDFPFSVEAKHYDKLYPKMKRDFWLQACNDAARINKYPMLMYRENGWPSNTWKVRIPDIMGLYPYMMNLGFKSGPLDGTRKWTEINSEELFKIPYNELIKYLRS